MKRSFSSKIPAQLPIFILAILLPLAIGFAGSWFTISEIPGWYATLQKPVFNPPSWLFAPVWTLLYVLMGYASFRIWRRLVHSSDPARKAAARNALKLYGLSLVLNGIWTPLFFGLHLTGVALADIIVLLLVIVLMIVRFSKVDQPAALILMPYLAWVSYATLLNAAIVFLNG